MTINNNLKIYLFNGAYKTLPDEIKAVGIEFTELHQFSVTSAQVVLELVNSVPYASIAAVLVAWIRARAGRKATITTSDNITIHTEGMSIEATERALKSARSVTVVESSDNESP